MAFKLETPFDVGIDNYDELAWQPVGLAYAYEIYRNGELWKTVPQAKNLFQYSDELPAYPATGGKTGFEIDNIPDFTVNSNEMYSVGMFFKEFNTEIADSYNLTLRRYTTKNSYDFYVQIPNYPSPSGTARTCNVTKLAKLDYFLNNKYQPGQRFYYEGNLKYNGFSIYYQTANNPSLLGNANPLELFFAPRMRVILDEPGDYSIRAITLEEDTNRVASDLSRSVRFSGGMSVLFYNSNAEKERVDKYSYLTQWGRYGVRLKDTCSITNPILIMQFDKFPDFNYCYIPRFKRYYYVDNVSSVSQNIWNIELSVDVLMSFKDDLLEQEGFITRNEFEYNDLLSDEFLLSESNYVQSIYQYSTLTSATFKDLRSMVDFYEGADLNILVANDKAKKYLWDFSTSHYISSVISSDEYRLARDVSLTALPNLTHLNSLYYFTNSNTYNSYLYSLLYKGFFENIEDKFKSDFGSLFSEPSEFIISNYLIPFDLSDFQVSTYDEEWYSTPIVMQEKSEVLLGKGMRVSLSEGVKANLISKDSDRLVMFSEISTLPPVNSFVDFELSKYFLYIPFLGVVQIESYQLADNRVKYLVYDIDITTGDFVVWTDNCVSAYFPQLSTRGVNSWTGNLYVQLAVGSSNTIDVARNHALSLGNFYEKTFTNLGINDFEESAGAVIKQVGTFTSLVFDVLAKNPLKVTSSNSRGGVLNYGRGYKPLLYKFTPNIYTPDNYKHYVGKPLNNTRILKDVHGFTRVGTIHLEIMNILSDESEQLNQLLTNGIILP